MPTLAELLGQQRPAPDPNAGVDPARPWDSPVLQPAQGPQPMPMPAQPYAYAPQDPLGQAQHLEERQKAMRDLSSPMTPVLALPSDFVAKLAELIAYVKGQKAKK